MGNSQIVMPFRTLPTRLRQMIEDKVNFETFEHERKRPRYSPRVQGSALHHYREKVENV